MKLDDLDISIIKYIGLINKSVTTTDIVKYLYNTKNSKEFKTKDNFIRTRLKGLERNSVLYSIDSNGYNSYYLNDSYFVISGIPRISINGNVFKGDSGTYIFVIKNNILDCILS